jgi:hypothetical protein
VKIDRAEGRAIRLPARRLRILAEDAVLDAVAFADFAGERQVLAVGLSRRAGRQQDRQCQAGQPAAADDRPDQLR